MNPVRLDLHAVFDLYDRYSRASAEQLRHQAVVSRVQMQYQHETCTGILRHPAEETPQRFDPTGGSADADDGEGRFRMRGSSTRAGLTHLDAYILLRFETHSVVSEGPDAGTDPPLKAPIATGVWQ